MIACCHCHAWAASDPGSGPSIYSAALDNPAFPSDTVDAQLKKLSAQAWFMIDAETGRILSSKNPDNRMYPASMTKMMTCILACESGRLNEIVTISKAAAAVPYGNVAKGEKYKLHDLLYRVMLPSDNGAAHAVGEFLANDSLGFAKMMNEKAQALGMNHTHFVNAHGLPDNDHYSTARDMMKLVKYCMKNKIFAEIVSNPTRDITTVGGKTIHLKNTNKLFGRYDGCIGVKTGTTRAAGGCLASAVVRNGMKIYLVLMKCEPARQRTDESIVLYNKGFEMVSEFNRQRQRKKGNRSASSSGYFNSGSGSRDVRDVPRPKNHDLHHDEYLKQQQDVPARRH
jgi:D-alanyl-D-alanine carboxypeptidase (penicillin-binding protein 5/6)